MVNIYEEQLKQLMTTSSQLDSFFILDQNGNFLLEAGKTKQFTHEDRGLLANKLSSVSLSPFEGWLPFSNGSCYTRMIPADCDTYIAACISYSNYYRDFYPLLLQLLMVLAAMVFVSLWIAFTITRKKFSANRLLCKSILWCRARCIPPGKTWLSQRWVWSGTQQHCPAVLKPDLPKKPAGPKGSETEIGGDEGTSAADQSPFSL